MQKTIVTISKLRLIEFLTEIEIFLHDHLPELHDECGAQYVISNLKKTLFKSKIDFHLYPIWIRQFILRIRNCTRMRSSLIGNPEVESMRIHIQQWPAIKSRLASETSSKEFLSIASKLIDEAISHLQEINLDMLCVEVDKTVKRSITASKNKIGKP